MLLENEIKQVCKAIANKESIKESKKNNLINKFKRDWIRIMTLSQLYNKFSNTYSLNKLEFTDYGLKSNVYIVPPLTFDKLDSNREMIEENLGCIIVFNHTRASKWITTKFIFNQNDTKEFEIIEEKSPYKIFIGNDYSGRAIFSDLRKYPHVLVSGTTRSGKSKMADCTITNLIVNCSPKELQLYLIQVAKNDLDIYSQVEHTRAFADTLEKTVTVLRYIKEVVMPERNAKIKPYHRKGMLDNAYEYNDLKKVGDVIPATLICFDEMASLFQTKGNNKEEKKLKEQIAGYVESIAQYGSSLNIWLFSSIQRPTIDNLPPFVKGMSNTLISLKQANSKSSEVATDDSKRALDLKQREFTYHLDNWDYGLVPMVNLKQIYKYIKPYIKPNHRTLFDDLEKLSHRNGVKKNKESLVEVGSHIKTEKEILNESISKIDNYVPYQNYTGMNIINETKLSIRTDRPINNGKEKI